MRTEVDVDSTEFYSCSKKTIELKIKVPGDIELGLWNVYFKLYIGKTDLNSYYMRSVTFANENIYESTIGANYLGTININSVLTDRKFYQFKIDDINIKRDDCKLYTNNRIIRLDGEQGLYEWTEDLLIKEYNGY